MHTSNRPAPEMEQLEFFVGCWEGDGAFLATPMSHAIAQPVLRVEAFFRHRGHWLEQRFTWVEQPAAEPDTLDVVEATRVWGYDRVAQRFVSEWFDNRGRRVTVSSPGWTGDRIVATLDLVESGREIHARETFERHGGDTWTHRAELKVGQDWILGEEQTLHRVSCVSSP